MASLEKPYEGQCRIFRGSHALTRSGVALEPTVAADRHADKADIRSPDAVLL